MSQTIFNQLVERHKQGKNKALFSIKERGGLYDTVTTEIDGRKIKINGRWFIDFASCNYLGFDLHPEIIQKISPALKKWGTHPSWARLASSPVLYDELEKKLASLLGTESTLVFPTLSLIHISVIPALVSSKGVILIDRHAHKTIHDGCRIARDYGAKLFSFPHQDFEALEKSLEEHQDASERLVCVDGVFSVSGRKADIARLAELCRRYDAMLYIDDAHGFGIIGENSSSGNEYGFRGNGVVKYFNESYENIIYVGGMSKAYSSLAAFVACPAVLAEYLKCTATTYIYSGPIPIASLASALAGLEINEKEGDEIRKKLLGYSKKIDSALKTVRFETDENDFFPIQSAYIGSEENVVKAGQLLSKEGIYVTLQAFPVVPKDRGVIRITPTAVNTDEEVDRLIDVLSKLKRILT